jgi:tRNA 2-thiouridine synthesizing protein A
MQELKSGEKVELYATDPSTERDIDRFCKFLGHNLLNKETSTEPFYFLIEKQGSKN